MLIKVALIVLITQLSGCSSKPAKPSLEVQGQKLTVALDNGGYVSAGQLAIDSQREVWTHDGVALDVMITAPASPGNYPLLIYLPSLGEQADAAKLWRESWAKAGYAVFSLQPQSIGLALKELSPKSGKEPDGGDSPDAADAENDDQDDEKGEKKRAKSARSSELRYLGHEFFAIDNLKARMQHLFWAYQQLKNRADSAQTLYGRADFSKVILAGYDLGAQTVAAVLGENFKVSLPQDDKLKPLAAILLSPSIDLAEGNVRNRFQNLNIPLLAVTGHEDADPYAISSASVRAAVWEFSPPGGKYLLSLTGNVHQMLAGVELGGGMPDRPGKAKDSSWYDGWFGGGNNLGGNLQYNANNAAGGPGGQGGQGGPGGRHNDRKGRGMANDAELGYKQVAAVLSASTAFLDAVVKNDEFAQFWLKDKANKWLDRAGVLTTR